MKFTIPGPPKGKARPRVVRTKNGHSHTYTPEQTVVYENAVKFAYVTAGGKMMYGQLRMVIDAFFQIPKSTSKKMYAEMLAGKARPTSKPDSDNLLKAVADALNGIAYRDDACVVDVVVRKWYSLEPRVEVEIEEA